MYCIRMLITFRYARYLRHSYVGDQQSIEWALAEAQPKSSAVDFTRGRVMKVGRWLR